MSPPSHRRSGAWGIGLVVGGIALGSGAGCGGARSRAPEPGPSTERGRPAPEACAPAPLASADPQALPCQCGDEATCAARCEGGSAADCFALGGCYSGLGGFGRDPARFVTYSARGCALGSASACTNLAKAYATGFGTAPDRSRADRLFARAAEGHRKGCQAGVADDCYMLGYAYEHGEGVGVDLAMTGALRQRACALGHTVSCLLLAVDARSSGRPDEAARWFGISCETTCTAGCKEVGEAVVQGVPAALRWLEQWTRRCAAGQEAACRAKRTAQRAAASSAPHE